MNINNAYDDHRELKSVHDNVHGVTIVINNSDELYLIKDGEKKRIHAIKVIERNNKNERVN